MRGTVVILVTLAVAGSLTHAFHLLPKTNEQIPYRQAAKYRMVPELQMLRDAQNKGVVTCTLCRQFLDAALTWIEEGLSIDELIDRLTNLCVSFNIFSERVCRGAIEVNADIMIWIAVTKNETGMPLTPSDMCGFALYPDCNLRGFEWTLDLDFMGPKPTPEVPQVPPDVAYVIFTGDIVDHAVWATTEQYNTDMMTYATGVLDDNFPNVPIINIFGNHEAHPCNVFSDPRKSEIPANLTQNWIYNLAADLWTPWLDPDTRPDILAGGMFTTEVRPGLVVIGINTMFCYSFNWFENTVMAQFHGHTHNDHFAVYYDLADISRATSVSFTAGSGTPFTKINPNYRIYVVDADPASYRVLDHETWYYNLTEANLGGQSVPPNWQLMYTFNDAYGTTAPFPSQMDDLRFQFSIDYDADNSSCFSRLFGDRGDRNSRVSTKCGSDEIAAHRTRIENLFRQRRDKTTRRGWLEEGISRDELVNRLPTLCVDLGIENERVCRGSIEINIDTLVWIYETKNASATPLTPADMCGFVFYPNCNLNGYEWTLDLDFLGPKPTPIVPQLPPDVAYVIFTGDIIDHASWTTSQTYNSDLIAFMVETLSLNFPDVPIINIFGNHESHPSNVFSDPRNTEIPANLTQDWLYTVAADVWAPWLTNSRPDILAGGMFSVEVIPGLEVIGINTMFCYSANW
ncbi:hypothetical protein B566_EDAN012600 [Ephemera danica]|nr:hypothetical protein B566_EDAN012600 [Ephemera danica]